MPLFVVSAMILRFRVLIVIVILQPVILPLLLYTTHKADLPEVCLIGNAQTIAFAEPRDARPAPATTLADFRHLPHTPPLAVRQTSARLPGRSSQWA